MTAGTFGKVFLAQRLADENGDAEVGAETQDFPEDSNVLSAEKTWMSQEASNRLGSVGYNPSISYL